jgi:hypothetical protein
MLADIGIFPLLASAPAFDALTQTAVELDPVEVDGRWVQQWAIEDLPPEAAAANLDAARHTAREAVKRLRDTKIQVGGYPAGGKWFHSDTFSRTQQLGLVMMGQSMPPGLKWKTMDGSFAEMTPALAMQVFGAAATQDSSIFAHAQVLIQQIDASDNPQELDITTGWPATYGSAS